jgi:hypothetical protein
VKIAAISAGRALILPFSKAGRRNIASDSCEIFRVAGDSPAHRRNSAMKRSSGAAGFESHSAPVASSRLIDAVAAALAIGSLSLCLIVSLTVFSIKVSMAMPIPA